MTKKFAVLASMMLVASLALAGCAAQNEELSVDDIIVEEVMEDTMDAETTEADTMIEEAAE